MGWANAHQQCLLFVDPAYRDIARWRNTQVAHGPASNCDIPYTCDTDS